MAVTSLQLTYSEIRAAVAGDRGYARDPTNWDATQAADVLRWMRAGLRKAYHPPSIGPGEAPHEWSFLRPPLVLTTTGPYSTGTVTIVAGVVTLAVGTFPSWAANGWLVIAGVYHTVSTRDSGSQVTLQDTTVTAAALTTYSLRQYRYTMPADFESLAGELSYSPGESTYNIPLQRVSDETIRELYQRSDQFCVGEPRYYAIVPATPVTTAVQAWYLLLYPTSDSIFHLNARYQILQNDLDGTNQYPPGGAQFSQLILEAVLSEGELARHEQGPHTQAFIQELKTAIARDRAQGAPDTLGCLRIQGENRYYAPDYLKQPVIPAGFALADLS